MRICVLAAEFLPNWGGTGSYLVNLLRHLPESVDLHVVTVQRSVAGDERTEPRSAEEISKWIGRKLTIHYVSRAEENFVYNMSFQLACLRELPKLDKQFRFDLIHSSHCNMPDLYYQLTKWHRIPTIVTVHDFLTVKRNSIKKSGRSFSRLDPAEKAVVAVYPFIRLCELLYLKKVTAFISPSRYYAGVLASHGVDHGRINVVPNGIDTSIFAPNLGQARESNRPSVLFTGRLVSHKGIDTILRAIPLVLKANSDVQFTFTGAGIPEIYLRQVEDRRVLDCVKFLGFIEDYFAMAQLYSRSDVFVLPSLFENCPMSVLEAMSSEVPVITTTVGGIPDIITSGENGILIAPHDHVALANNIISLLSDKAYAARLAKQGRQTVLERYSAKRMASTTMDVYEAVANAHKR
jgi:glycosyltransferase involved in cell wall biosynthesis